MTSKTDAIKDKLRKILAIVKSNGNEHERDMAMMRLQEMLVKHRLELSDVEQDEKQDIVKVHVRGFNGPWARNVCNGIAQLNFCSYYYNRNSGHDQRLVDHFFVGQPHEVEVAKELSMLILEQLNSESRVQARMSGDRSFQRSFLNSASTTVFWRAMDLKNKASQPNTTQSAGTALMVLNAYALAQTENMQWLTSSGTAPKLKKSRMNSKSYAGRAEGKAFGEKIPLHLTKSLCNI